MRALFVAFLLGHAAVHVVMWTLPFTDAVDDMPFDPAHSWLLGDNRMVAVVLAGLAALAFVLTAFGYGLDVGWWPTTMLVASAVSIVVMVVTFTPWWLVGIALDLALVAYALQQPAA